MIKENFKVKFIEELCRKHNIKFISVSVGSNNLPNIFDIVSPEIITPFMIDKMTGMKLEFYGSFPVIEAGKPYNSMLVEYKGDYLE